MHDPFEQFERSRLGWLIPVVLFVAAAIPTALAIHAMVGIEAAERADARPGLDSATESDPRAGGQVTGGQETGGQEFEAPSNSPVQNSEDIVVP